MPERYWKVRFELGYFRIGCAMPDRSYATTASLYRDIPEVGSQTN